MLSVQVANGNTGIVELIRFRICLQIVRFSVSFNLRKETHFYVNTVKASSFHALRIMTTTF